MQAIFELMDTDKDGNVDAKELRKALKAFGYSLSDAEVDQLMSRIDLNMDGARPRTLFPTNPQIVPSAHHRITFEYSQGAPPERQPALDLDLDTATFHNF